MEPQTAEQMGIEDRKSDTFSLNGFQLFFSQGVSEQNVSKQYFKKYGWSNEVDIVC